MRKNSLQDLEKQAKVANRALKRLKRKFRTKLNNWKDKYSELSILQWDSDKYYTPITYEVDVKLEKGLVENPEYHILVKVCGHSTGTHDEFEYYGIIETPRFENTYKKFSKSIGWVLRELNKTGHIKEFDRWRESVKKW